MSRFTRILCILTTALPAAAPAAGNGDWWSLRPLVRPAVPGAATAHPVDAFIRATLAEKELQPAPAADPRTIVRRMYFDLHGLPPTADEVEAFAAACADGKPETLAAQTEKLADRLLASPRYGERWARHWFDTIHFADSHGFEHDVKRENAWRFRDYVIGALNGDIAWPQFIREQIAADVLFPDKPQLTAALGFLGAGTYDSSAAATAVNSFEYLDRDDLVTQTMAAFVSTTANCARCHEHKFDPITQEDYFALQAVFAGIGKGDISYDADPETTRSRARWQSLQSAAAARDAAVLLNAENTALVTNWEKQRGTASPWTPLLPETYTSTEGAELMRLADGSLLSGGPLPDKDTYTISLPLHLSGNVAALRLDLLPDERLPVRGPGRAANGNLHLSEFTAQLFPAGGGKPQKLAIKRAVSDFDQDAYGIAGAVDGKPETSWAIHPQEGKPHTGVFELSAPAVAQSEDRLLVSLRQLQGGSHLLGRFQLSVWTGAGTPPAPLPPEVESVLTIPPAGRTPEQRLTVAAFALQRMAADAMAALPPPVQVWAASKAAKNERGVITYTTPRTIRVLRRGELDKPGTEAAPGTLSAITALPARFSLTDPQNEGLRRAALAEWLAAPQNPLTWRSIVNRVWHWHFGKGLCATPSDFGRMGGVPSHPALLDWMAVWFRDDARGSLKALHRLIVTSAAWRQSSAGGNAAAEQLDPDNRLLWRMNRARLDADAIRDAMRAAAGTLDLTMGGPGIEHFSKSPGPQATPKLDYNAYDWNAPGAGRRSIYRVVWRGIADPFMDATDFPELGLLAPARGFSASALQALTLFNNNFTLYQSTRVAQLAEAAGPAAADRVRRLFRLVLQREPSAAETADFAALADTDGLASAARVLFNSNEFLFVD